MASAVVVLLLLATPLLAASQSDMAVFSAFQQGDSTLKHFAVLQRSTSTRELDVVIAAGGFESNLEWLAQAWGEAARNFLVRGTPYNKGKLLRLLLDSGAGGILLNARAARSAPPPKAGRLASVESGAPEPSIA